MSISPSTIKIYLASKSELRQLYVKHGFEQKIAQCRAIEMPKTIHPFCCTTVAIRYIDPQINEEIAVIAEVVSDNPDGPEKATKRKEITKLLVGSDIYRLKHP